MVQLYFLVLPQCLKLNKEIHFLYTILETCTLQFLTYFHGLISKRERERRRESNAVLRRFQQSFSYFTTVYGCDREVIARTPMSYQQEWNVKCVASALRICLIKFDAALVWYSFQTKIYGGREDDAVLWKFQSFLFCFRDVITSMISIFQGSSPTLDLHNFSLS